ncbi:MAG: DUF4919 domain-containing protein [Flavobacteriales bacterium]|nr:DUF4919 domain-containing protein [Flavobacteriales bacterium]MCB9192327.1 DUF4919 domain-containing protein [Flavobacteriales bacterium]MCB9203731.1 DUF4919 domain-containing protein [Flavobacteriales bacterium]
MLNRITLLFVLISSIITAQAQVISEVDFDAVNRNIQDPKSDYYYQDLVDRMMAHDTTLGLADYHHIYYGSAEVEGYSPYGDSDKLDVFKEKLSAGAFDDALDVGVKIWKSYPGNIESVYNLLICADAMQNKPLAQQYANHYFAFLEVIYRSGTGRSIEDAWVVMRVRDEYLVLNDMGLERSQQALLDGPTDEMTLTKESRKKMKKKDRVKALYFNVAKPFESMSKMFKK